MSLVRNQESVCVRDNTGGERTVSIGIAAQLLEVVTSGG